MLLHYVLHNVRQQTAYMLCRLAPDRPAHAEFTVYSLKERLQTSITLQDGCFGTATLMRIAALFMAEPTPPTSLPPAPAVPSHPQPEGMQTHPDRESHVDSPSASVPPEVDPSVETKGDAEQLGSDQAVPTVPHQTQADRESSSLLQVVTSGEESPKAAPDLPGSPLALAARVLCAEQQLGTHNGPSATPSSPAGAAQSHSESDAGDAQPKTGTSSSSTTQAAICRTDLPCLVDTPPACGPGEQQGLQNASALAAQEHGPILAGLRDASFATSAVEMLNAHSAIHIVTQDVPSVHGGTASAELEETCSQAVTQAAAEAATALHDSPVDTEESAPTGPTRCEQFSLEIVRCKAVCPAKTSSTTFTQDESPLDHTLYMEVPHFLLQLPYEQPAQHPRPHPVNLNVRHVLTGQHAAVPAPSPFAAEQSQGTICALTNLALFIALPEEFDVAIASHSRSAAHALPQLPPMLCIPTASLLAVGSRPPPFNPSLHHEPPSDPVPTLELEMKIAEVIAKPAQLQTISASTLRYTAEMDIILGIPPSDQTASTQAAEPKTAPDSPAANSPAQQPGFALEASVGMVSLQLHSSDKRHPALVLQWQRLSGHYAWAASAKGPPAPPAFTPLACGLSWHYLSLQLAKDPVEQKPQFSLANVGTLRSGSLLVPSRLTRAQSDPAVAHMGQAGSSRSSRPGSARRTQGGSVHGSRHTQGRSGHTRAVSPEEEYMQHQHSLSRLHVAPAGNTRGMGLSGLTALAEIAADDNESVAESVQYIFNNRARLASDSFAEALEAVLPTNLSATSLNPAQPQEGSDTASSSLSGGRSHRQAHERRDLQRLMSGGASVASSHISIDTLQRQVPVIRHRPFFLASIPSDDPGAAFYPTASSNLDHPPGSMHSRGQSFQGFYDAPETEPSSPAKNWSPAIDKLPVGDRLLLLLGSKETLAPSDASEHHNAAMDASIGCSLQPNPSDASALLSLEVCATDMLLRVYLEVGYVACLC